MLGTPSSIFFFFFRKKKKQKETSKGILSSFFFYEKEKRSKKENDRGNAKIQLSESHPFCPVKTGTDQHGITVVLKIRQK